MLSTRRSPEIAQRLAGAMRASAQQAQLGNAGALCVVDLRMVALRAQQWSELLPRVKPHYAVKCNPDPEIAATLASLGVNFDCASAGELDMVTGLGVSADRVVYAHPCKPPQQLAHAMKQGCKLTVVDGEEELQKVAAVAPDARVLLRIKVRFSFCHALLSQVWRRLGSGAVSHAPCR